MRIVPLLSTSTCVLPLKHTRDAGGVGGITGAGVRATAIGAGGGLVEGGFVFGGVAGDGATGGSVGPPSPRPRQIGFPKTAHVCPPISRPEQKLTGSVEQFGTPVGQLPSQQLHWSKVAELQLEKP